LVKEASNSRERQRFENQEECFIAIQVLENEMEKEIQEGNLTQNQEIY
jgi:hypothetical protein